jgi:hypothetical protein
MTKTLSHFRTLLNPVELNEPFHNEEIEALMYYHPYYETKIRGTIEYLIIRLDPVYKSRCLYLKLSESSEEIDVSWRDCVRHLYGKFDVDKIKEQNVRSAFRNTIWDKRQRENYLILERKCTLCQKEDIRLSMDHYPIPFKKICNDFLIMENITILLSIDIQTDGIQYFLSDENLKNKWILYHDAIAQYRVLCISCNSKNGSYGY